jgi:hypothetical protein
MTDDKLDLADADQRIGASIFLILKEQLARLGYRTGTLPFNAQFGSPECRGALMGTAIAIARGHREEPAREHYIDAIKAAFTVVYGPNVGMAKALETIEDSAGGSAVINTASDRAGEDTQTHWGQDSTTPPMAYNRGAGGQAY